MSTPRTTGKLTGTKVFLLTTHFSATTLADSGCNQGKLDSQIGLCHFSWHSPRDARNCDVRDRHSGSAAAFLLDVHGHQPKVWQSCGDRTHGGVSNTPGLYWNNMDACIEMPDRGETTKTPLTFEDSRLWPQGCPRHVAISACFDQSEP